MPLAPSATSGNLHHIPPINAFEPTPVHESPSNLLIWIGGLTDTYHSVQYPYTLSKRLPNDWSLAQVNLSSAGSGWGTSSLGRDVDELSKIVAYFGEHRKGKIVIMGHSTGCQDCIHYLSSKDEQGTRAKVDGAILQAPVSDAEAIKQEVPKEQYEKANKLAKEWIDTGRGEDVLPQAHVSGIFGSCAITARRWLSLASPDGNGEDDYFSSYLSDEKLQSTFGRVKVPILVLMGEKDEYVPLHVDRKAMVGRWVKIMRENNSPVDGKSEELLGGASHNLNGNSEEVVDELINRVTTFLKTVGQ
ncbi:hypothetical protein BDV97DRAFT_359429 [Delphinella strobiligena]|nr:hypothetical protein BDV97DRAFT_359429 [Delphinella strobiligena]